MRNKVTTYQKACCYGIHDFLCIFYLNFKSFGVHITIYCYRTICIAQPKCSCFHIRFYSSET
ncbi:hypothetical protein HanRHA438_Chr14g0667191 [Helianthus annuus]|nr:hypothetical protein HanRHA438_Chr14g0667191 [Helianthus annuus]